MNPIPFQLIPFAQPPPAAPTGTGALCLREALSITGSLNISRKSLEIHYLLDGELGDLVLPCPAETPQRRDLLWQSTCLELFLAPSGRDDYWEFNLSPAGHWNVYRLEGYRQGLRAEPAYGRLPFQVHRSDPVPPTGGRPLDPDAPHQGQQLALTLCCPLPPPLRSAQPHERPGTGVEVGITAVIQRTTGSLSYWALHHPADGADFHHRGGFTIQVPWAR